MVFAHRHHDLLLFRCDAAMLHSLNSGRATSDWTASGRSLVKSKRASMAAIDWVGFCFVFFLFLYGIPFLVMSMLDQETLSADPDVRSPPHPTGHGRTRTDRQKDQSQSQTGPGHAPPRCKELQARHCETDFAVQ